jgi:hypothetical protein
MKLVDLLLALVVLVAVSLRVLDPPAFMSAWLPPYHYTF